MHINTVAWLDKVMVIVIDDRCVMRYLFLHKNQIDNYPLCYKFTGAYHQPPLNGGNSMNVY